MADKTYSSVKCEVKSAFDPKYKSVLLPVMREAVKKGIEASGDFAATDPHPGDKDAKSFTLDIKVSVVKDDKSKPPKLKVSVEYTGWLTGKGTSGQQFKGSANGLMETGPKIDDDVKDVVKEVLKDMLARDGKMFKAMRGLLKD